MEFPTREKQTAHITRVGTGEREWRPYGRETGSACKNRGKRLTKTEISTREKEIAHITTEGTGDREWRYLRQRNSSARNNSMNRRDKTEIPTPSN
jgi:hypothetical protein